MTDIRHRHSGFCYSKIPPQNANVLKLEVDKRLGAVFADEDDEKEHRCVCGATQNGGAIARCVVSPENRTVYPPSINPLNSRGLATSASDECEKLCEVLPQSVDPLALDPRLRSLLAHWESLPELLRESLFRQFSEAVVLQSVTQEPSVIQAVTQETIHSI